MKRIAVFLLLALVCAGIGRATFQATIESGAEQSLSPNVPAGPLLYLEAKDFSSLLADWNSSSQKRQWFDSSNYDVFSRSRLFLRLKGASDQFAIAAGLPPDMNFLSQVAGTNSVLALYDIGNLQFVYITHLPSAKSMQTTLWQARAKFEPRSVAGVNFYLRRDPESQKEAAFAVSGDYLLLATREDLMAGALQLMSGGKDRTIESEPWWSQSVGSTGAAGDLRMVLNLGKIAPSPYFRTYWVQQNITDMGQYSAAISDLFRASTQYREERVLLRKSAATETFSEAGETAAADLVRLVPGGAGIYEARANPSTDSCFDLLETKLLAPHLGMAPPSQTAPQVQLTSGETGAGPDLETRIDQPTVQRTAAPVSSLALKDLLSKTPIFASLQVQSTEQDKAGVFVRIHTAIVLTGASDWDQATVQTVLTNFVQPAITASQLGVGWQQKSGYWELDGLWPLATSVHGKYLLVADDPALMESMLSNFNRKTDLKPATFLAGFNPSRERSNFSRFTGVVDRPNTAQANVPGNDRQPQFFSQNIASLSGTLADVSSERITVHADQGKILQTVTYEWTQ